MASLLRPEVKFDGIDPLVKQMNEDKAQAKHLLSIDFDDDISYIYKVDRDTRLFLFSRYTFS